VLTPTQKTPPHGEARRGCLRNSITIRCKLGNLGIIDARYLRAIFVAGVGVNNLADSSKNSFLNQLLQA